MKLKQSNYNFICDNLASLLICLVLLISTVGCTDTIQLVKDAQPTKAELLDEINTEHQRWEAAPAADPTPYLRHYDDPDDAQKDTDYLTDTYSEYEAEKELTVEEAEEDVNYLFDALYYDYALYDYFGGHAVFDQAKDDVLQEVQSRDSLTCEDLQKILVSHLTFIKDGHFNINQDYPSEKDIPFFFRQVMFVKTDLGYQNANGKVVASVDNYPDLDELFKRSISAQGYLVYYPVLLKPATFDGTEWEKHTCDETLTVHYTDGSTDTLTADTWSQYYKELPKDQNTDLRQTDGIPVFQFNSFDGSFLQEVNAAAAQMSDAAISMLDMRSNVGGYEEVAHQWITRYSRQRVQGNGVRYNVVNPVSVARQAHRWQTHDNILILLSGKCSASSGEIIMDLAYNLENSLIIGENTNGSMIGNSGHVELPNSKCSVNMTFSTVYLTPDGSDYFEEMRGLSPDIWVPAGEAETLAAKLMKNLK